MVNIGDITEIALKNNDNNLYESIDYLNYQLEQDIDELMNNKFLLQVVRIESLLKDWINKFCEEPLDGSYFEIYKTQTELAMVPYSGYWSIGYNVVVPDVEGYLLLNLDENFLLGEAFDTLSTTKYNFKTNELNSCDGEKFKIPFNDTVKVYDFFLPEDTLRKFNASKLSLTLDEKSTPKPKRKI